MSELKKVPQEILESQSHESDKSKVENIQKGLAHNNKSKRYQHRSKQQKDKEGKGPTEDPPKSDKSSVHSSSGAISTSLVQALVVPNDTTLFAEDIQGLGTNEKIKSDFLKISGSGYFSKNEGIDRKFPFTDGEVQAISNISSNNFGDMQNMLRNIHTVFDNLANNFSTREYLEVLLRGQRGRDLLSLLHCLIQRHLMGISDSGGDYDPERTKLTADLMPFVRSVFSAIYLVKLETKGEIITKVQAKDDKSVDFSKAMEPMIDKCSWRERNEESDVSTYSSEEEESNEGLASPDYCGCGDIDNIIDQSAVHGQLDDHVQQFNNAQAAQAEDQDEDEDDSVTDDSSSEESDEEKSSYLENGSHELAGKGEIISIIFVPPQSEMAGKQPHPSLYIQTDNNNIEHHLSVTTCDGLEYAVTTDNVTENLAIDTTLQNPPSPLPPQPQGGPSSDAEYTAIEQTPELPVISNSLGETVPTPTTLKYHSVYEFPQPEGQYSPFPSEVDASTEGILPEGSYIDAVEAESDKHSEENTNSLLSAFLSSPAENVDTD